jgi:hypothetical protein
MVDDQERIYDVCPPHGISIAGTHHMKIGMIMSQVAKRMLADMGGSAL